MKDIREDFMDCARQLIPAFYETAEVGWNENDVILDCCPGSWATAISVSCSTSAPAADAGTRDARAATSLFVVLFVW